MSNILVIDTQKYEKLEQILGESYHITYSDTEQNVLEIISESVIDLILVNYKTSKIDGCDIAIKIRKKFHLLDIPMIFIVDSIDNETIDNLYDAGGNSYISNSFRKKEVLSKLTNHLGIKVNKEKLEHTLKEKTTMIDQLLEVGISLTSETNFDHLMEKIVLGTKDFSNADACTIYLMSKDKKSLEFSVVQTDKLGIKMGGTGEKIAWPPLQLYKEDGSLNDNMVAVKCALEKRLFNFDDVYNVEEFNFEGTKTFDKSTSYRTKSMIVVPMLNTDQDVVGVIQLINKLNATGEIVSFSDNDETLLSSMSSLGGVSVHNNKLLESLNELLDSLELKVQQRTADLEKAKKEVEAIHRHTRESIEYASLIQGALLPDENLMANYFTDYFVHWMPKDTVGGDIWLFDELRHEDECLLFFIDCTGHGVPGAFVTMIVKAIEREITTKINNDKNMDVSPAWVMSYFNQTMKVLLKQETKESSSNAGWDGGIIYYNKKENILKFAGAETPLFYTDVNGELNTVKGNRYSVGYKKCDMNYQYKETIIHVEPGMKFYCTTDGYLDQNGGAKDFPFGKKQFTNIIKENHTKEMATKKDIFIEKMDQYESMIENNDRNDDMTVIAFEIGKESVTPDVILSYKGIFTQNIIAQNMLKLEDEIEHIGEQSKVSTLVIELTQNIMNYSKILEEHSQISQEGAIEVLKSKDQKYHVRSQNLISIYDKEKLEPILEDIQTLDKVEIRKRYRELRKTGEKAHEKGGGIGFYEIARLITDMQYSFNQVDDNSFEFNFDCIVKDTKEKK